ncbi:MAG: hypothetical protein M3P52_01140, partial [Actinomycetota bacterium]|nr:hypothetical protein [Actinomycetota bacterium]
VRAAPPHVRRVRTHLGRVATLAVGAAAIDETLNSAAGEVMGAALPVAVRHDATATMAAEPLLHAEIPERRASKTASGHDATTRREPGRPPNRVIAAVAVPVAATGCPRGGWSQQRQLLRSARPR